MYVVPGGRIGFRRPTELSAVAASTWHLLSPDQTFQVEVREALRIDAAWDDRLWQPDRHELVASGTLAPGIEHRHWRDQRFGRGADYGADTHVLRDGSWIGQVRLSTSTLGAPAPSVPGGQIARWRAVADALVASLAVRPSLPPADALAELRVALSLDGLNPRFAGDKLVLSLAPPATPYEASGTTGSHILLPDLSVRPRGRPDDLATASQAAFAAFQATPGSRIIAGADCRAVVLGEQRVADRTFATRAMAFARTRQLALSAFYGAGDRGPMLQAFDRVVSSLALPDVP